MTTAAVKPSASKFPLLPFLFQILFLGGCCLLLTVLWLPGTRYPIVSDALNYAMLGRSLWEHGQYVLGGTPWSKHLPLHALLSYPLVKLLGLHRGMHLASLLGGFGVLLSTFFLVRKALSAPVATLTAFAVLIHPGFILMSQLGSADLLFTAFFLLSLVFYLHAEADQRWYVPAGLAAGLACLTRYNGLPLFPLFLGYAAWKRRAHLRAPWLWIGLALGAAAFSLWLLRNAITFGNPFFSGYRDEMTQEAPNILVQFLSNVRYYVNPVHNIFPFFFVFAAFGLVRHAVRQPFLLLAMLAGWVFSSIWWVQAIRFFFPGYPLLLAFAALGLLDAGKHLRRHPWLIAAIAALGFATQIFSICIYTYGACNAWFDRTVGILPANMGLTSEGFYAWGLARDEIDLHAPPGASVLYEDPEGGAGVFRGDLRVTDDPAACPLFTITQRPQPGERILFQTEAEPVTAVTEKVCVR